MVGFPHRDQAESFYRASLQELSDRELERELRTRLFMLRTKIDGPYTEDLWKRDYVRNEFKRRGKLELFEAMVAKE